MLVSLKYLRGRGVPVALRLVLSATPKCGLFPWSSVGCTDSYTLDSGRNDDYTTSRVLHRLMVS